MLRIHFTAEDLLRTRITTTYGPLAEALLGVLVLKDSPSLPLRRWRQQVLSTRPMWAHALGELVGRYAPVDLFTLIGPASGLPEALESLEGVGAEPLRREIRGVYEAEARLDGRTTASAPSWARRLPDDRDSRRQAVEFFRRCHATSIAPYWDSILSSLRHEVATRSQLAASGGVEQLLTALHPRAIWSNPVLSLPSVGAGGDVFLGGRGVELVPSVFAAVPAIYSSAVDESAQAVLIYPVVRDAGDAARILSSVDGRDVGGARALAELVGRTRAAVLIAADEERTTSELARRVGISVAGASQHSAVLRKAGLLRSRRDGAAVLHRITDLGLALLHNRTL